MRIQRFALVAIAALSLSVVACGKSDSADKPAAADKAAAADKTAKADEKAPAEGDKAAAKKTEPAAADDKAAKPAGGDTAKPAADPKAAAVEPAKAGGATEPAKVGEAKTEPAAADPKTAEPPTTAPATGPVDAIVMAGTPSLDALLNTVKSLAETAGMPSVVAGDAKKRALDGLRVAMEVSDASWLDTTKPIRIAVVDPKRYGQNGAAILIPITDKAKMLASLKPGAKKDHEGHAAMFDRRGMAMYVDMIEGHAVVTTHGEVFKRAKAAITDKVAKWTPTKPLEVRADMAAVNGLYAADLKRARQMVKELYGQMAKIQGQGDLGELAGANLDMLFDFVESATVLGVRLDTKDGHLFTDFVVEGKKDSGIAQFAAAMKGKSSALVNSVPKGAWFSMASNIDARNIPSLKELQGLAIRSYVKMLNIDDAATVKKIDSILERQWAMAEGDGALAISTDGKFPMAFQYVATVTDAAKAQAAYHELTGLVIEVLLNKAAEAGQKLPVNKDMGLVAIIQALGKMSGQMGVKLSANSAAAGGAQLDVMELEVDWAKFPPAVSAEPNFKMVKSLLGNKLQIALAYAGKNMAMAFGPNAKKVAPKLALGKFEGGDPALAKANAGNALAMVIHPGGLIKAFQDVSPGLADKAAAIAKLGSAEPFVLTGATEGAGAVFTLDLPLATITQLVSTFR